MTQATPPEDAALNRDIARLAIKARLARGVAHTLNNVFTVLAGEASYLREELAREPKLTESCATLEDAVARAIEVSRALTRPSQQTGEVELAKGLRGLVALLSETIGSRCELRAVLPDSALFASFSHEDLELIVCTLVQLAADQSRERFALHLTLAPLSGELRRAELRFEIAPPAPVWWCDALVDPARAPDAITRRRLCAFHEVIASAGGSIANSTSRGAFAVTLQLPLA